MSSAETLPKQTSPPRERLEARVSADLKQLFQQAADLQGVTLSDFLIGSARHAAVQTLQQHQTIRLGQRDARTFLQALLHPAPPGRRLRAAAHRYQKLRRAV